MKPRYHCGTPVSLWRAVYLCLLAILRPSALAKENDKNALVLNPTFEGAQREPAAFVICRAFWLSFAAVSISVVLGFAIGYVTTSLFGCANSSTITAIAGAGAGILLWGTLFVRGWQVQTFKGVSLSERVNQWLYWVLYCLGTVVVVWSVSWSTCKP